MGCSRGDVGAPRRHAGIVSWSGGAPRHGRGRRFVGVAARFESPAAPRRAAGAIPVAVVERGRSTTGDGTRDCGESWRTIRARNTENRGFHGGKRREAAPQQDSRHVSWSRTGRDTGHRVPRAARVRGARPESDRPHGRTDRTGGNGRTGLRPATTLRHYAPPPTSRREDGNHDHTVTHPMRGAPNGRTVLLATSLTPSSRPAPWKQND